VLSRLVGKSITEQRARLDLDGLGIPPAKIDAYITDALDGTIDSPELQDA
jgi:hypothetical protein